MKIIQAVKSLKWADFVAVMLFDPRFFAKQICESKSFCFKRSFIVPLLVSLSIILSLSSLNTQTLFFKYKMSSGLIFFTIVFYVCSIIFSLLVDFYFQFKGFMGMALQTISLVNFSFFPFVFLVPLVLLFAFPGISFLGHVFFVLGFFAAFFWFLFLLISYVSESRSVNLTKSLIAVFMPLVVLFVLSIVAYTSFISLVVGFLETSLF